MHFQTDDLRIQSLRPLLPPAILMEELPLSDAASEVVAHGRESVAKVLRGEDDRLVVVAGPCSIHDPKAGLEYARRLRKVADEHTNDLCIVMRVYFEKPRTTVGWKGLINDPDLDESFAINKGLRTSRRLLLDIAEAGLPAGCEFLDTLIPQFIADVVAWGAIGARTTESQVHRELASGMSMPIGFKNGTDGNVQIAIDAIRSAANPHHFLSITKQGVAAIVATKGNPDAHVILRGGANGTNFDAASVAKLSAALDKAKLPRRVMIDCSHANSGKDHLKQPATASAVAAQVAAGDKTIIGVMLESFLEDGREDYANTTPFGKSITDACMSWERTLPVFAELSAAVRARRAGR
ncbi:MAG: 3-deoxy-7-phosphoheptulonate synthase [Deltaproteobacteria bacterium]|nr:3-deoxy-7-phosphoheptulonate synthase [Deltaproteobacteria bacterium]